MMTSQPPSFSPSFPRLVGDIGGTNARFALQLEQGGPLRQVLRLPCQDFAGPEQAIRHYLAQQPGLVPVRAALGVADSGGGDEIRLTNNPWTFSTRALQTALRLERLLVINDFTALALAIPDLKGAELHAVGRGKAVPGAPRAVLGPGTGLGVSGLTPVGSRWSAIEGKGGHVSLSPATPFEATVIQCLHDEFGHASAERALSGPGLVNLHRVLGRLAGLVVPVLTPAEVVALGRSGQDATCVRVLDLFFAWLGSVAGDLALTLGAVGGVYIGGGIVPRLLPELERSAFRERFESKGRFRDYLRAIPCFVIVAEEPSALYGAARALDQLA